MTRKQIDGARELRLWVGQLIIPGLVAGAIIYSMPEVRHAVSEKKEAIKRHFRIKKANKFFKEKS